MKAIAYYRVSTSAQGRSGLGLEAQRMAVSQFCGGRGCEMLGEFVEVESGKIDTRPELTKALHLDRRYGIEYITRTLSLSVMAAAGT